MVRKIGMKHQPRLKCNLVQVLLLKQVVLHSKRNSMPKMEKDEEHKLMEDNPHLRKYIENISLKMSKPTFYTKVPKEEGDNKYPNLIYPTKGIVFIHMVRTPEMEQIEYHAVE